MTSVQSAKLKGRCPANCTWQRHKSPEFGRGKCSAPRGRSFGNMRGSDVIFWNLWLWFHASQIYSPDFLLNGEVFLSVLEFFPTAIALRVFSHSKAFGANSCFGVPCGKSLPSPQRFCGGFPQLPTLYTSSHLSPSPLRSKKFRRKVPELCKILGFQPSQRSWGKLTSLSLAVFFGQLAGASENVLWRVQPTVLLSVSQFDTSSEANGWWLLPVSYHFLRQMAGASENILWRVLRLFLIFSPLVKGCCFRKVFGGFLTVPYIWPPGPQSPTRLSVA